MAEQERQDALAFMRRLVGAWDCCGTCAGGVLAARDAALIAEAKVDALREAADAAVPRFNAHPLNRSNTVADWLRDRAANVTPQPTPGRCRCGAGAACSGGPS